MKVVLQDGIKDCGICSLLSVIRFYGGDVSKEYLREITQTSKNGVTFYQLIEGAKKIGFSAIGVSGDLNKIDDNNLPCLAHFIVSKNYKHFVVIYKIDKFKKQVVLMDPAKGKKIISFAEFNLLSSKNYIFLKPLKPIPKMKNKNIIRLTIKSLFGRSKNKLILVFILTFLVFFLNILVAFHFKYLLEFSINYLVIDNIYYIGIVVFNLYLCREFGAFFRNLLLNKLMTLFDNEITFITYRQLLLLPYLYYKNRTIGEVVSRFRDLNIVKDFLVKFFVVVSTDLLGLFVFFIIMFKYSKNLTLIVLIFFIVLVIFLRFYIRRKKKLLRSVTKSNDLVNSYLIESISNVDTVKGTHLEKRFIDTFLLKYKKLISNSYNYSVFIEYGELFKNIINDILLVLIYAYGSYLIIMQRISLGTLIVYQSFFMYCLNSFNGLIELSSDVVDFVVSLERIEDMFLIKEENFKNSFYFLPYKLNGDIEFINFSYKISSKYLFWNVNLLIKQGSKVLIYGKSGSGKSTLLKILMRYIDVPFGMVKINGIDINHYHLENIRRNICYVSSNEYLFTDSLKNNICLYKDVLEDDFNEINRICLVDEIIEEEELGYDKLVEENGFNFSSGEKQRIVLARSLLKNSDIYIFDEALGQIDTAQERIILSNIFTYLKDKTIIVISHRLNNASIFDKLIRIEDGCIYED